MQVKILLILVAVVSVLVGGFLLSTKRDGHVARESATEMVMDILNSPQELRKFKLSESLLGAVSELKDTDYYLDRFYRLTFELKKEGKSLGALYLQLKCQSTLFGMCVFNSKTDYSIERLDFG